MESAAGRWNFAAPTTTSDAHSVRGLLGLVLQAADPADNRALIRLGPGDPGHFPSCFGPPPEAVEALLDAVRSGKFNCYGPQYGLPAARRAVADRASQELPYQLSADDVLLTNGCSQAIELVISVLARRPGGNILLPRPGYQLYEAWAFCQGLEVRFFNLLPDKSWEVDIDSLRAIADDKTVAMLIINPGNPCGNVYSYDHLAKISEAAEELGLFVIADEVYSQLAFGSEPFVPMGVFGATVPVLSLGSISKTWIATGWRLGWIAMNDPNGVFRHTKLADCLKDQHNIMSSPATFVQGALPQIIKNTRKAYYDGNVDMLRRLALQCYERLEAIDGITCPCKPQGGLFFMVKLELSRLEDIKDDMDFCCKLIKEEMVLVLPGCGTGYKNWLRITFAVEPSLLEEGLERLASFCIRHKKQQQEQSGGAGSTI